MTEEQKMDRAKQIFADLKTKCLFDKNAIVELKALNKPPVDVYNALAPFCKILGESTEWL